MALVAGGGVVMHQALMAPDYLTLAQPVVQVITDDWFRLRKPWSYRWRHKGQWYRLRVAEGFEFDGASIPTIAHPFFGGRWSLGLAPPLAHDALYRCGGDLSRARFGTHPDERAVRSGRYAWYERASGDGWEDVDWVWPRRDVDRLFGRHMREAGVARWRRRAAYLAVRAAGRWSWRD